MALDDMLAAEIEKQLTSLDRIQRAELVLDLIGTVHNYVAADGLGGEGLDGRDGPERHSLEQVMAAARSHLDAAREGFPD